MTGVGPFKGIDKCGERFVRTDEIKILKKFVENSLLTYICRASNMDSLITDHVWQVKRIKQVGSITTEEFAGGGEYAYSCESKSVRDALFPSPEFENEFSLAFDGVDEYLNGGDIFQFDIATAFTISMWVKPQNLASSRILFSKAGSGPTVRGYMLRYNATSGDLFLRMRTGITNRTHAFDVSLTSGIWQHVVFSYSGNSNISGASAYVNATKNTSTPSGSLTGSLLEGQDFYVGQRSGSFYFSGNIDSMTVWNKELSQSEVTELYNGGSPLDPTSHSAYANLISSYKMGDGDSFPTIFDNESTNDLTMVNMESSDITADVP